MHPHPLPEGAFAAMHPTPTRHGSVRPQRIVIAPDSFKESMSAAQVAREIAEGLRDSFPSADFVEVPMADGGEGTMQSLVDATGGTVTTHCVEDPLGRPVDARLGILGDGDTAVIEMAQASGLELLTQDEKNALTTSTFGTGQLILTAHEMGLSKFIIGIGGSATNDGGAGMLQALGGRLLDGEGRELPRGGAALARLARIDVSGVPEALRGATVRVACDVTNPLTGPDGASAVFGPQKGATAEDVAALDSALENFARVIERDLGLDVAATPGAGAAGGLGAGLMALLAAELAPGIDIVIDHTKLREQLVGADLVITGEGAMDAQTRFGKTPYGVAKEAKALGIPVIGIAGSLADDATELYDHGFDALFSITPAPGSLADALAQGPDRMRRTARNIGRALALGATLR